MNNPIFTELERQVIALAATSATHECGGSGGISSRIASAASRLLTGAKPRPLANPRLEALRRLACAVFASGGRAGDRVLRLASEAGLSQAQIAELSRLASSNSCAYA